MKRPGPSLLAWQIAWFNESTWLERLWRRSWWEYLDDKSTLTDADGGARGGHNQKAAQEN